MRHRNTPQKTANTANTAKNTPQDTAKTHRKHRKTPQNTAKHRERTPQIPQTVYKYGCGVGAGVRQKRAEMILRKVQTIPELVDFVYKTATTERKLMGVLRKNYKAAWPDYPSEWSAYGYTDVKLGLGPATSEEIDDFDLIFPAIIELEEKYRQIIWAVAHSAVKGSRGAQWSRLGRMLGVHPATVKKRFERAIVELWYKLKKDAEGKKKVD